MAKIALLGFSVALAIGAAACATDPEQPDYEIRSGEDPYVVITQIDFAGGGSSTEHIDIGSGLEASPWGANELCPQVAQLPGSNVCSVLCNPPEFVARVFGGSTGCTNQQCALPNGSAVTIETCN